MSDHYWISEAQVERIKPYFPRPHGRPRVDDRRVISGIIHVIRNGLRWRDAPAVYGPSKTLYNRFIRWSKAGVFNRIFATLAAMSEATGAVMIDATHLKAHRTAASLLKRGCSPSYRADKGRPELQAACGLRRRRQTFDLVAYRRPGQRLSRCRDHVAVPAGRRHAHRRQGL